LTLRLDNPILHYILAFLRFIGAQI
jgi:hypothetical protein